MAYILRLGRKKKKQHSEVFLMEADYSQMELRVATDLSNDPVMVKCYAEKQDIHRLTAASVLGCAVEDVTKPQRQAAKPIDFGTIFDMSARGLQENAKKEYGIDLSDEESATWRKGFFRLYRGYRTWMIKEQHKARVTGSAYIYWCGEIYARRWLPDLGASSTKKRGHALRQVLNTPIQGGASVYTIKTINALHRKLWYKEIPGVVGLMHTIHDSVILSIVSGYEKSAFSAIADIMVSFPTIRVPLEVEAKIGPTLGDMHVLGSRNSLDRECNFA